MGIRSISLGMAAIAVAVVGSGAVAAPVTPSVAKISLAPAAGTNLGANGRVGARKGKSSSLAGGGVIIGVLAAAAVAGGVVAATDSGGGHSTSP